VTMPYFPSIGNCLLEQLQKDGVCHKDYILDLHAILILPLPAVGLSYLVLNNTTST
jgi:hypothetical protein